jgi:hypothetical protein
MKPIIPTIAFAICTLFPLFNNNVETKVLNNNTPKFSITNSEINTKYSEFPSGIFRNKLIIVSSKKIGAFGNGINKNTNEPFSELFCIDMNDRGELSNPLLFSRTLNTKHNEGQITFTPNQKTVYYTRSLRKNSKNFQLYRADLDVHTSDIWINEKQLTLNKNYSIENPHISPDGRKLYFSSNLPGSIGGFDIYVSTIFRDGSLGVPKNLGEQINTVEDDKFPFLSKDGKQLYFSSKGHDGQGGFDVFVSHLVNGIYDVPKNLEDQINTPYDEVAFMLINDKGQGFFSSNKSGGQGGFDIYNFQLESHFKIEEVFASNNRKK